jgi:ribonucleoside-diphosphate reductase alpha chain
MVDHPNIKSATSLIDYIFRVLGYEYLGRTDLVHVLDAPGNTGEDDDDMPETLPLPSQPSLSNVRITVLGGKGNNTANPKPVKQQALAAGENSTQDYMRSMQSDAPACNTCGHITVRSGTCYKCLNCGNSMGCS